MVRGMVVGAGFLAGVLGFTISLAVQLATVWWSGVAVYAQWLLLAQAGLLAVVTLALLIILRSVMRARDAWEDRRDSGGFVWHSPARRMSAWAQVKEGAGQLRPWWPLVGLGFLFGVLLLNLGTGGQVEAGSPLWQLYLLRVQSSSWMILYFVPAAVIGPHIFRRGRRR